MKHFILFSIALLSLSTFAFAQKKKTDVKQPATAAPFADQPHAKNYLIKTSRFAGHCHRAVFNTKKYTGDLGQMVRYERYAKKLYEAGKYREAIFFSRRARQFGSASLAANGAIPTSDGKFTADEEALSSGSPTDEDLEKTITAAGEPMLTDESLMAGNLGLEIK
ncbi:MAG: hypothetical protein JWO58_2438 [Chitinophagaceae bacterium]|nr:hypothetical protein [Chitinophagaceae bacterium]